MRISSRDTAVVVEVLRDVLGHDAGVKASDVPQIEAGLAERGLALIRSEALTLEPGDPDHPAQQIGRIVSGEATLAGGSPERREPRADLL